MGKQLGFLIDLSKCVGCKGCEAACRNEHQIDHMHYRRVIQLSKDNWEFCFLSLACSHCLNPECIRVCPRKCFYKRRDGIVLCHPQSCSGCQSCVGACPFQAPKVNPRTKKITKCNFCFERIEQGLDPACVAACVVGALTIIDLTKTLADEVQETLQSFPIIRFTKPSLRFILPKSPQCFWRNDRR